MMLLTDQTFTNSLRQKTWLSICFKTRGRFFEALARWAFEALKENQTFVWEFEKFSQVFKKLIRLIKKLDHVFAL